MKNLEKQKYWIWLSLIKNLGCIRKKKLLEIYRNPEKIYQLSYQELMKVESIGEVLARAITDDKIKMQLPKHIEYMEKNGIEIVSILDEEYPKVLKEIYDPPISLYCKGDKTILGKKSIGIVGCRDASEYGKKAAKYFAYQLAKENVVIVSGLARGIDSYAHIGNICAQGKTIAVIGNGLDRIYPEENTMLAQRIVKEGGVIVSEYPLGTKPDKMNFPARNRIISGLSTGILVVEAKKKSGTLITVDFALEQGKDVFVVPGNIDSINSVGTNDLIKQGAKMVTHYSDII